MFRIYSSPLAYAQVRRFSSKVTKPALCYYKVLNVSTNSETKEIKGAYY